jgi:hypothetical protein
LQALLLLGQRRERLRVAYECGESLSQQQQNNRERERQRETERDRERQRETEHDADQVRMAHPSRSPAHSRNQSMINSHTLRHMHSAAAYHDKKIWVIEGSSLRDVAVRLGERQSDGFVH